MIDFNIRFSFIKKIKGHHNSSGDLAEYCILSHENGKILASFSNESDAKSHLQDMHSHKGSFIGIKSLDDLLNG
jgi:hypothetical protein